MVDENYTESILNMVLDEIDDIIMIHDSEHTLVWMNRAGLRAFGLNLDNIIGKRCYSLFGNNSCCEDCDVASMVMGSSGTKKMKVIPKTKKQYTCSSLPLYQGGKIKLVVQHLREIPGKQ